MSASAGRGPPGPPGARGPAGPQGPRGPRGEPGTGSGGEGSVGPQGPAGPQGPEGPQGDIGPQGPAGVDGQDGAQGPTGPAGAAGPQGPAGPTGPAGANGVDGDPGADGADAYEVAVENGFIGTALEWLETLVGPPGADGADGATGPEGPQGPKGDTGDAGATGPAGPAPSGTGFVHVTGGALDTPHEITGDVAVGASGVATIQAAAVTTSKMGGDVTAAGKALLDDADAAAQRTTLGLGTAATQASGAFEVAGAVAAHAAAADPHAGYQKESERAAANGYASLDGNTRVPDAQLGSGTPDSTRFLRGDRTWAVPAGGGGGSDSSRIRLTVADRTYTNQGAGPTESAATADRTIVDLASFTNVRLLARVKTGGTSSAIKAQYSTDGTNFSDLTATISLAGTGLKASVSQAIPAGALGLVELRLVAVGGNGTEDPVVASGVTVEVS